MSRQLKFRAWDQFNAVFYYSDKYKNLAKFFVDVQKYIDGGNYIVIEEFTGLNDVDDIDIYESDIVDKKYLFEVTLINQAFWCRSNKAGSENLCVLNHNRNKAGIPLEVIGNIHQNPELLK